MRGVREEVSKLLAMDPDDPETYEEMDVDEDVDRSNKRKDDGGDHLSDYEYSEVEEQENPVILDGDGDADMPADHGDPLSRLLPQRRLRKKTRQGAGEEPDQVMLTHKVLTKHSQEARKGAQVGRDSGLCQAYVQGCRKSSMGRAPILRRLGAPRHGAV